jgi:hypothetical protein
MGSLGGPKAERKSTIGVSALAVEQLKEIDSYVVAGCAARLRGWN